jgi:hypothetical protein
MADPEHLRILKKGVEVFNKWREENPFIEPNLCGANLSEANLHRADLSEANLREADLSGADLRGVNFRGANFSEAILVMANLGFANLSGVDLRLADLSGADLRLADLEGANLRGAYLIGADLSDAYLRLADLRGTDLRGTDLMGADLWGAIFSEGCRPRQIPHGATALGPVVSFEPDQVTFAAFAPRCIAPNSSFILYVWAFLPHQRHDVIAISQESGSDVNVGRKNGVPVPKGELLTISVDIEELEAQDPIDTIIWKDEPTNASFIFRVPSDTVIGDYPGVAIISYKGIKIAKIKFLISVATHVKYEYIKPTAIAEYPRNAYASYASEDREDVLSRIHGMKKIAPKLEIFFDVLSLRSGQEWWKELEKHVPTKDTFYLFWSQYAARSKWVEREWQIALSKRGLNYIDPVPLEDPERAPPPQELRALHFSDAYLLFIDYQRIKKELQSEGHN